MDNITLYNVGMNTALKHKLTQLPQSPGVYFYKDDKGKIIYVGKASILKRRVSSYFQNTKRHDRKTSVLVTKIHALDWIETASELDALFLESEMIKRYKPAFNVLEKDDKNNIYIKITVHDDYPVVSYVRRPSDDRARYFGPFLHSWNVKSAMKYLRKIFPYITDRRWPNVSPLQYQIGVMPHPDTPKEDYRAQIFQLIMVLEGRSQKLVREIERAMKRAAREKRFEEAAQLRNQYLALRSLEQKMIFGKEESHDLTLDQALSGLSEVLGLKGEPRRIEAYDISNFAGGDAVSSMIVFTDGLPNQAEYRKFKMRTKGPNDFAMMRETLMRRFSGRNDWPRPDVILIDGGKGQLSAALEAMTELGIAIPMFGLAKRLEEIVTRDESGEFVVRELGLDSQIVQLLQRVRDEAHRFAVSYHTTLRDKRTKASSLDTIPGVGPVTRRKLIRSFGSVAGVRAATASELRKVVGVKARVIKEHLR